MISILEDYEVKRDIISLHEGFQKVERIDQSNQNLYDEHFYPYLRSNFDLVNWKGVEIETESEEGLYYAKEFANTVSTYRYLLLSKKRIYMETKEQLEAYIKG